MTPDNIHVSLLLTFVVGFLACTQTENNKNHAPLIEEPEVVSLDLDEANRLASLPAECICNPLPYKSGHILTDSTDLKMPGAHHPAFYGCFDWHSAVHGHWSLVYLLKNFPDLDSSDHYRSLLHKNLTEENLAIELQYFKANKYNASFERTYGWAWLLKLQEELLDWSDDDAKQWASYIEKLAEFISQAYQDYLPKLVYPIRVGEHSNTAFGLSFAYDYATRTGDEALRNAIEKAARRMYMNDVGCPINWEPSGYDFLSPCLQELDIMRKVLKAEEFEGWAANFIPDLFEENLLLEPAKVSDRSDGKLVHLDGLNFSRAWCLYNLPANEYASQLADEHMKYSLDKIVDGDYAGQHWLASFALYAYKCKLHNAH